MKNKNSVSLIKNYLFSISLLTILIQIGCKKEIERYTTGQNIIYKTSKIIVELKVQKNRFRLLLRTENGEIKDPKLLTEIVPETHGWGNLTHIVYLYPGQNLT